MAWFRSQDGSAVGVPRPASGRTSPPVRDSRPEPAGTTPRVATESEQRRDRYLSLKCQLHQQVIGEMDLATVGQMGEEQLRREVRRKAEALCQQQTELMSQAERERLVNELLDETFGLGPLEPLLRDYSVSDILVNGPKSIFVERRGRLERTEVAFRDDRHLLQVVQRIAAQAGRRVDETSPMVDARLTDGSRLNAIIAPLALDGTLVSIRRFGAKPLAVGDLVQYGSITSEMVTFLEGCVRARINLLISGGTGSGKTTLLNGLSKCIPHDERVATIEDAAELQLQQPHVVRMETRPPNIEGLGEVTTRDLVRNCLRMRPDRIIIGECRGAEALDMLQAMNTGHDGSLTTVHANSPRDAVTRLEMMVGMAGLELPLWIIRRQITSSIQIVVQVSRLLGGVRRVTRISEITGMEGEVVSMQDLFEFVQTGVDEQRVAQGYFRATGIRPALLHRLDACGVSVPSEIFERRNLDPAAPVAARSLAR